MTPKRNFSAIKSMNLIRNNINIVGLILLFDIMFIGFYLIYMNLFRYLSSSISLQPSPSALVFFILISLVYYLLAILVYSFFKYSIIHYIKSMLSKASFSLNRLWEFFGLNTVLAGFLLLIYFVLSYLIVGLKQPYQLYAFLILMAPFAIYSYIAVNSSQIIFTEGSSISNSLKKGASEIFSIRRYLEMILLLVAVYLLFGLVLLSVGYILKQIAGNDYLLQQKLVFRYINISMVLSYLAMYIVHFINRISFYSIFKKETKNVN